MAIHNLKTDSAVFLDVAAGNKSFEIRKNDRDFQVGDTLRLMETEHSGAEMAHGEPLIYTGAEVIVTVQYILHGPIYGLADGWVIMSIARGADAGESEL